MSVIGDYLNKVENNIAICNAKEGNQK